VPRNPAHYLDDARIEGRLADLWGEEHRIRHDFGDHLLPHHFVLPALEHPIPFWQRGSPGSGFSMIFGPVKPA